MRWSEAGLLIISKIDLRKRLRAYRRLKTRCSPRAVRSSRRKAHTAAQRARQPAGIGAKTCLAVALQLSPRYP